MPPVWPLQTGCTPTLPLSPSQRATPAMASARCRWQTARWPRSPHVGFSGTPTDISADVLTSATAAQTALGHLTTAIAGVAADRGALGAETNRLQSASSVITNQVQNLTNAEDGIRAADIPSAVANMSRLTILQQTGMAALQQSNQMQQSVLKLLQ